ASSVAQVCSKLLGALGHSATFSDQEQAIEQLSKEMGERECLLVLDGVEDIEALRPLFSATIHCARLVISSERKVVSEFSAKKIAVDQMSVDEGVQLLGEDSDAVRELVILLGRWVPALMVARGLLGDPRLFRDAN